MPPRGSQFFLAQNNIKMNSALPRVQIFSKIRQLLKNRYHRRGELQFLVHSTNAKSLRAILTSVKKSSKSDAWF